MTWNGIVSHDGHAIIVARQTTASTPQAVSILSGRDAVPGIPHRFDRLSGAELLPQPSHADVDDVRARIEAVAPHLGEQTLTAHDFAGVADEMVKQPKFAVREVDEAILDLRLPARQVELNRACADPRSVG